MRIFADTTTMAHITNSDRAFYLPLSDYQVINIDKRFTWPSYEMYINVLKDVSKSEKADWKKPTKNDHMYSIKFDDYHLNIPSKDI